MTKYEDLRPCTIIDDDSSDDIPAMFHEWCHGSNNDDVYAIVEYENGRAGTFEIGDVRFTDHTEPEVVISNPRPQEPKKEEEPEPQKQEEPEVTYKIGDKFFYTGSVSDWKNEYKNFRNFVLASVGDDVGFVNVETGRFIGQAVCPQDCDRLTAEEFSNLCGSHEEFEFELIITEDNENGQN